MARNPRPPGSASKGTIRVLPLPLAIGLAAGGAAVLICAFVGLFLDGPEFGQERRVEAMLGIGAVLVAALISRTQHRCTITRPMAMSMFVTAWVGSTVVAMLAFWLSGELATLSDGLFEAVSASSTTGLTTVSDPQELSHALRLLRVLLPWCTGIGVLIVSMGVLPAAIAGVELTPIMRLHGTRKLVRTPRQAVLTISGLYIVLTVAVVVGFLLAGMGPFDAVTYGLSVSSTSGMSNHADSLGHFDSVWVDAVATGGMIAAGGNLLVVWWALRGAWGSVWRSTELRLYAGLLCAGFISVYLGGSGLSAESSAFSVASMMSTTGLRSGDWASAGAFPQTVLLILAGLGAMAGSAGSGFRLARVARVALEVRRRLQELLNPARISILRMDGVAVDEASLQRTFGYLWMHAFTLASVAVLVNTTELDIVGTASFAVAIVSNAGVYVDNGTITSTVHLSSWSETIGMLGMLFGRLSIYPVLLTAAGVGRWLSRRRFRRSAIPRSGLVS